MMQRANARKASFAHVYDALYGGDAAFLAAQLDFLRATFGPPAGPLLDIGCGTGAHVAGLAQLGYSVIGTDIDPLMLREARRKLPHARLVLADMRRLPFPGRGGAFAGALCLESPLAYLTDAGDLGAALQSIRETLRDGGLLVLDVYDYPTTLGKQPAGAHEAHFETASMRVRVVESHRYGKKSSLWTMRQEFTVEENGDAIRYEVVHRLRIRDLNEYARRLEGAGFNVLQALTAYPNTPETSRHERRIILVARV